MKVSTIIIHIIPCLMVLILISGCSHSHNQVLTLCKERQMNDDRRLHGNPYDSVDRQNYIQYHFAY
jgi:hypothetical protein